MRDDTRPSGSVLVILLTVSLTLSMTLTGAYVGVVSAQAGPNDFDIPYSNDGYLYYVDGDGNEVNTTVESFLAGGAGDIDGDGDIDFAYRESSNNFPAYIDGAGNTQILTSTSLFSIGGVGDIDDDGDLDVALRDTNNNLLYVDADGNVNDTGQQVQDPGPIADFDGDGDKEIVFIERGTNEVKWVDAEGNVNTTGITGPLEIGDVADLDGDGDEDVTLIDSSSNLIYADPSGNTVDTGVDASSVGGVADIGGDGTFDMAYTEQADGDVAIKAVGGGVTILASNGGAIGYFGDIDGDGCGCTPDTLPEPTQVTRLELEIDRWMPFDSTQDYRVILNQTNTTTGRVNLTDVTDTANVTVYNITNTTGFAEPIVSVNNTTNTLQSYNQTGVVAVNATWNGRTLDNATNVTVANRNLTNIGILPPEQWLPAFLGVDESPRGGDNPHNIGSSMQWTLFIIVVMSAASKMFENPWAGVGGGMLTAILLWVLEFIALGLVLVTVFSGILLGLIMSRSDMGRGVTRDNEYSGILSNKRP